MRQTDRKAPNKINNQAFNRIEQRLNELDINFKKVTNTTTTTNSNIDHINPNGNITDMTEISPMNFPSGGTPTNSPNGQLYVKQTDCNLYYKTVDGIEHQLNIETNVILKEKSSETALKNYGKIWVKDDVPNNLYFTNDTGQSFLLNNVPGTILGYKTHNPSSTSSYTLTTSCVNIDTTNAKITFVPSISGKVKIDIQLFIDEGTTTAVTYLGLSNNATYNSIGSQHEKRVNYGNRGSKVITHSWLISAVSGVGQTLYIGARASGVYGVLKWGGTTSLDYPPLIITATAL